jgi:hypothetical protein
MQYVRKQIFNLKILNTLQQTWEQEQKQKQGLHLNLHWVVIYFHITSGSIFIDEMKELDNFFNLK